MRLGFVAAVFVAAFTAAGTPLCLRVGSYNVRNSGGDRNTENDWALRKADLSALVRSLDLDVFGLQEVLPDQADYLRAELPAYAMAGVHRDDGDRRGEASPVFYRTDRFEAVKSGMMMPIPFEEILNVTKTTFAVLKAVKSGKTEEV